MSLEVRKKERESSQSLVRRFSKRLKRSGILIRARKNRFRQRTKSKQMRKKAALRKEEKRKEYETKKRMGNLY